MNKNPWGFQLPDSFFETQRIIKNMTSAFEIWNKINQNFSYIQNMNGVSAMVASYQNIVNSCIPIETTRQIMESFISIQAIVADIQIPKIVHLTSTLEKILPAIDYTWEPPEIDYEWANEKLNGQKSIDEDKLSVILTDEVQEELDESVKQIILSSDSQSNIESKYADWKQRHPLLADLFIALVLTILGGFISGMMVNFATGTLTKPAKVYEEPKSTSNIVINVDVNQNVTVVNDIPYYYEIIYTNPETGEEKAGYISKKNISIIENNTEE